LKLLYDVIKWEALLHDTMQHAGQAQRNLEALTPGHPTTSPGNGGPGGGGSGDSIVHRLVESRAFDRDHIIRKLADLQRAGGLATVLGGQLVLALTRQQPVWPRASFNIVPYVAYAYRCVIVAKDHLEHDPDWAGRYTPRRQMTEACVDLWTITTAWSSPATQRMESPATAELLAVDLTEMYCRSCLRIGWHQARHRGELCRWCYNFHITEGFMPPRRLIIMHNEQRRITEKDIAPLRQAHQRKVKTA